MGSDCQIHACVVNQIYSYNKNCINSYLYSSHGLNGETNIENNINTPHSVVNSHSHGKIYRQSLSEMVGWHLKPTFSEIARKVLNPFPNKSKVKSHTCKTKDKHDSYIKRLHGISLTGGTTSSEICTIGGTTTCTCPEYFRNGIHSKSYCDTRNSSKLHQHYKITNRFQVLFNLADADDNDTIFTTNVRGLSVTGHNSRLVTTVSNNRSPTLNNDGTAYNYNGTSHNYNGTPNNIIGNPNNNYTPNNFTGIPNNTSGTLKDNTGIPNNKPEKKTSTPNNNITPNNSMPNNNGTPYNYNGTPNNIVGTLNNNMSAPYYTGTPIITYTSNNTGSPHNFNSTPNNIGSPNISGTPSNLTGIPNNTSRTLNNNTGTQNNKPEKKTSTPNNNITPNNSIPNNNGTPYKYNGTPNNIIHTTLVHQL